MRYLLPLLAVSSLAQPLIGDLSGKSVARRQPEKLAAMEAHFHTQSRAPLLIGGWPDEETRSVTGGIYIPGALSFMAHGRFDAEVTGLDAFPEDERPPVLITHLAFQMMVGIGSLLALVGVVHLIGAWRRKDLLANRWWLKLLAALTPAGFIALEAGWIVTEVGRQPWIIYRIMRTADSVTPVTGLGWSFAIIALLYTSLAAISFFLLARWFNLESRRDA